MRYTILVLLVFASRAQSFSFEPITAAQIKKQTKRSCTFVHVWASWCSTCVQELPGLIRFFENRKAVYPIIVDISHKMAQEQFSAPWLKRLNPTFPVYRNMHVSEDVFMKEINASWQHTLPYNAVYIFGKKKKEWMSGTSIKELSTFLDRYCAEK